MSNQEMSWQRIAAHDPFLAGAIAARGVEWWEEVTAESEADSVKLEGEARQKFLAGWQFELDEMERQASKGDPAYWM